MLQPAQVGILQIRQCNIQDHVEIIGSAELRIILPWEL